MSRAKAIFIVSILLLTAAVTVAGFFYDDTQPRTRSLDAERTSVVSPAAASMSLGDYHVARNMGGLRGAEAPQAAQAGTTPSYGTEGKAYQRDAAISLRVNDVFETLSKVEKMVADAKGYLESIDVSGNTTSHDGTLRVVIPSDKFTEVFGTFRKLGDLQTERITSHMVGEGTSTLKTAAHLDQTELVRIDMTLSDNPERLAQTKLGSVMSMAWTRGMEHFGKGGAVLLEGLGYVVPFFLVFGGIMILVGVFGLAGRILRRVSSPKIPYAVPIAQ